MHLRAIKLRGFKSFPDPVEVRLEQGVAVVVGPNGSGKSNVSDALLWAAGSLAPSELRAEKPDDVLFAGGKDRPPADFCEVELVFDNEDGALAELPFAEVSFLRRLHRGGEGQYLVNRAPVRRTDLVELLADVGLGGNMGSIISQGRVEEILGSKPEERRQLVEEAAGLGRFKHRRHRAELKLARVAIDVERARDLEAELKKRLRPLALQATAAERAEKLRGQIGSVKARIAQLGLALVEERRAAAGERREAATLARNRTAKELEALLRERDRVEGELVGAAGSREEATAGVYRLKSAAERLELRRESAQALAERLRADPPRYASMDPERERLLEEARLGRERLGALERTLLELEGLPPAARALAEQGERLVLSSLEVGEGDERAVAAALAWRAAAVLAPDAATGLKLLEQARAAGLGNLGVVVGGATPDAPIVPKEHLLEAKELSVTREGFAYDPQRGELWYAGEAAEAVLLELDARRRALESEIEELDAAAERAANTPAAPDSSLAEAAERLASTLAESVKLASRFEPSLGARAEAKGERARELGEELRELGAKEAEVRRTAAEAGERSSAVDVELATLAAEAKELNRRIAEAGAEPSEGDDPEELRGKLERLERKRETLGSVNPLAKEEYDREKERLTELRDQRADLEQSLTELQNLRDELAETVERRFEETFTAVRDHFEEVAATLFPGGEGRLRLTEPELEGEDEDTEPGIEIELRPAGKKVTRLSLLSGGEKALGAISFLFALFLARPHPFYLLDEVEAALDDANIGRFVELLRRYAERAQFIVITHQKKTMEAADVLYGVTMGADGVSQIVSRRLPREAVAA
ncbi:MAG TPA: AAA family ATPase [Gaiellaceae bacterium]|nr:AAA family ATPase [Gaiellaceae bacterium]